MSKIICTTIGILVVSILVVQILSQSFNKYEVIVDHGETSENNLMFDSKELRVKKFNRTTFVIDGYVDLLIPFSDDLTGVYTLNQYQGNEYRKLFQKTISNLCTESKKYKKHLDKYVDKTSIDPNYSCPYPTGRVFYYNLHLENDRLPVEPPSGVEKFRLDIEFLSEKSKKSLCFNKFYVILKKLPLYG